MKILRFQGTTLIVSVFMVVLLFVGSLQNALPSNPMDEMKSLTLLKVFPQGWGFFSKSPREESIMILNSSYDLATVWPNNSFENLLGVKRFGRTQGIEMGLLYSQIPENMWTACESDLKNCVAPTEVITVNNTTPVPSFCGEYIIVKRQVVPWAWSKIMETDEMPLKFAKVVSSCSIK